MGYCWALVGSGPCGRLMRPVRRWERPRSSLSAKLAHETVGVGNWFEPVQVRVQARRTMPSTRICDRSMPMRPVACLPTRILRSSNVKISALSVECIQSHGCSDIAA